MINGENKTREEKCDSVIRNHMVWSMGAGLIPIPIADFFAVSAIQLDMIRQLAKLYEIDFSEQAGKASITALTSSGLARLGARAVKFIPGVGTILGGITMSILSGASSYALGEVFKKHFETGGTFLDFEPARVKKFYNEQFEKGKTVAGDIDLNDEKRGEETAPKKIVKTSESLSNKKEVAKEEKVFVDPIPEVEDPISKIMKLAEMKEEGIITEEEFISLKSKIIG